MPLEFFLNGAELSLNSVNSGNLANYWSMNWAQLKDAVSHMCLAGTVVASWSLTREVAGPNPFIDKCFCHRIRWIHWKHLGKTPLPSGMQSMFLARYRQCERGFALSNWAYFCKINRSNAWAFDYWKWIFQLIKIQNVPLVIRNESVSGCFRIVARNLFGHYSPVFTHQFLGVITSINWWKADEGPEIWPGNSHTTISGYKCYELVQINNSMFFHR